MGRRWPPRTGSIAAHERPGVSARRLEWPRHRRPARTRAAVLVAIACLAAIGGAVPAAAVPLAPPLSGAAVAEVPAAAPGPPTRALCGTPAKGTARCFALARTDVAPRGAATMTLASIPPGYGPADLQSAYDLETAAAGGAGATVAVIAAFDLLTAEFDLATYRAQFGLPPCSSASGCFRKVDQRGGSNYPPPDSGWGAEIALDIEMVSAICPHCSILLVEADSPFLGDLGEAVNTAVDLGADAISNSYGAFESFGQNQADAAYYDHPGVVITASSGDNGYGVYFPAASPHVVAVGGTTLSPSVTPRGWTEAAWSGSGSGCSAYSPKPAWQQDSLCNRRTVADLAAVADPATGVAVYASGQGGWVVFGGTSASAPIVAAAYALAGAPLAGTYPGQSPYTRTASLYDVTSGSNGSCGSYLCNGGPGFDGPTGLGTPAGIKAISPLPFTDISSSTFVNDIVWLYDSGITKGCTATTYCPTAGVTRGQMAAFLARGLGLPATATDYFADDEGTTFENDINRLAAAGITKGCTATTFCPTATLTRGQMAAFLDRALGLPPTATDFFTDDDGTSFEASTNRLAAAGITTGCTATTFCPTAGVTRGQMAAFLHRALD
jgi:hypothetical protein